MHNDQQEQTNTHTK